MNLFLQNMRDSFRMDYLGSSVVQAIVPFRPGRIDAFVDDQLDGGRKLTVEVEHIRSHDCVIPLDLPSFVREPDGGLSKIYQKVFDHYRYRPALPVDDHIVLGEE